MSSKRSVSWRLLAAVGLAVVWRPMRGEAGAASPPRRVEVCVLTTSRRSQRSHVMPGEWLLCSSQQGLWIPYWFEGRTQLAFRKHAARIYLLEDGKEGAVAGVRLGTQTGRSELRTHLQQGTSPLMIWCNGPAALEDVPPLPPDGTYGLSVDRLSDLSPLAKLRHVRYLRVTTGPTRADLSPLAELTGLESLSLTCSEAPDLGPLAALTNLKVLHLYCEEQLKDIRPLGRLTNLRLLALHCADGVTDVAPFARLTNLTVFVLRGCSGVRDLSPLAALTRLTWLDLSGCGGLASLSPVGGLADLTWLDLSGCGQVSDLAPLASLTRLEALGLRDVTKVTALSPLADLPRLREVDLTGCAGITDLWPLRKAAQRRPHRIWVDPRLRLQLIAIEEAAPDKVTVLMNEQHVTTEGVPPDHMGELGGWVNIVGRTVQPPAGLGRVGMRMVYPVWRHKPGALLHFQWNDPRVFLTPHGQPRRLAGIVAVSDQGRTLLRGALARDGGPLMIWASPRSIPDLPPLPPGRDLTLVALGLGTPLKALRNVRNLTGLHVESAAERTSDLAPIAHLTDLKELGLPATLRVSSLANLAKMTRLTSLAISLDERVTDIGPLARLADLQALQLSWSRAPDLGPLANLPRLRLLDLRGPLPRDGLEALRALPSLEALSLDARGGGAHLAPLAQVRHLRGLHLRRCDQVAGLASLAELEGLQVVALSDCNHLSDLAPLTRVPGLRVLRLEFCGQGTDLPTLRRLEQRGVELDLDTRLRSLLDAGSTRPLP